MQLSGRRMSDTVLLADAKTGTADQPGAAAVCDSMSTGGAQEDPMPATESIADMECGEMCPGREGCHCRSALSS